MFTCFLWSIPTYRSSTTATWKMNHCHSETNSQSYTDLQHHSETITKLSLIFNHNHQVTSTLLNQSIHNKTSLFKPRSSRRLHWQISKIKQNWLNWPDTIFIRTLLYVCAFLKAYPHVYALFKKLIPV